MAATIDPTIEQESEFLFEKEILSELQYIVDAGGTRHSVIIPIEYWELIRMTYLARRDFQRSMEEGFREIQLAREGKVKLKSAREFMDEL